jgi:hypothetical protein
MAESPRRNALFGVVPETCGLRRMVADAVLRNRYAEIPCYRVLHFKRLLPCEKPKHCNGFLNEFPTQISRESTPLEQGKL